MYLDTLGTGELCTFSLNQQRVVNELLLADDAKLVRLCKCNHFWELLAARPQVI